MRAAQFQRFGTADELRVIEVQAPRAPGPGEVRIAVHAAALNPKDALLRKGHFGLLQGRRFPKGTAHDFAGIVDAIGRGVEVPAVGDPVFGMQNGFHPSSAAEQVIVPATELARMPAGLGFEAAASLPLAGLTALQGLRNVARVQDGQHVVVRGASGGVGTLAVQIARALGARVTAICSSANLDMVRELGAEAVYAYDRVDPLAEISTADVFFDVFGNLGFDRARVRLSPKGIYVGTLPNKSMLADILRTAFSAQKARLVIVRSKSHDLAQLARWAESGKLRAVIETIHPLDEVAAAHRRIETRRTKGKLVLRVRPSGDPPVTVRTA